MFAQSGDKDATVKKAIALLLVLISAQGWAATKVEEVHFSPAADMSRLILDLSSSPTYKVFRLADRISGGDRSQ